MVFEVFDVAKDGKRISTGKTIELKSAKDGRDAIVNAVFALYGFNQYTNYYSITTPDKDDGVAIQYNYGNEGTKDTWYIKPKK